MKKWLSLFLFSILFSLGFSQTHRFVYELHFKRDSANDKKDSVKMVLDVGKDEVKFYDLEFLRYDSISRKTGENWQYTSQTDQLLKRKFGSNENLNYRNNLFDYFLIESKDELNWNIFPETKNIATYKVQKAETDFGGRHWIAWFCDEIPINEGPYKFRGLPGLIFEIYDSEDHYFYTLINSKKLDKEVDTSNFLEAHYGTKPIKITNEKFNEIKLNYFNDPYSWAKTSTGKWSVNFGDGKVYNKKEDIPYLTKRTQEEILTNNNPIEIDKAVKYPLK